MNKKEILKKSRKENRKGDERERQVHDRAMALGYIVILLTTTMFRVVGMKGKIPADLSASMSASVCSIFLYRFIKTKDKLCLVIAIMMMILTIFNTVGFFTEL